MRRAHAMQDALITNTGVDPKRVFVVREPPVKDNGNTTPLEIKLKQ
jgi:hypothetical protein